MLAIDRDTWDLHSDFREPLATVLKRFNRATGLDLRVYESWRSPLRQAAEYELGRTKVGPRPSHDRPMGGCVTWALPWHSLHQWGCAADLVFWVNGAWTWEEPKKGVYAELHTIAKEEGLTPLYNRKGQLIETGHIQLAGVTADDLLAGCYYDTTDEWARQLTEYIQAWQQAGHKDVPHLPVMRPEALAEAS